MAIKRGKNNSMSIKSKLNTFQKETRKHTATALMTAFGIALALTWKSVIDIYVSKWAQDLTISQLPSSVLTLYSAIVTTLIIVIGILITNKWIANKELGDAQTKPK